MKVESGKEEVIKYSYVCDLCGKESSHKRVCCICGRDICYDCTKFDPRDYMDHPDKYCSGCFDVGQKYLEKIAAEQEKFDDNIEELEQEWRDEAIKLLKTAKEKEKENKPDNKK